MSKIPDNILLQLGRLTVNFGCLEVHLNLLLWGILSSDQRAGQIVTAEISFRQMLRALRALAHHRLDSENAAKLALLLDRAGSIEDRRNSLVHSFYVVGDQGDVTRVKMSAKGQKGFKVASEPITGLEIEAVSTEIREINSDLKPFLDEFAPQKG